jgi:hypothetical protein
MLGELLSGAGSPEEALSIVQEHLIGRRADDRQPDTVVSEAVRRLMPWRAGETGSLSSLLAISESQLRRRCLAAVVSAPRACSGRCGFHGFLAVVLSTGRRATLPGGGGLADLAAEAWPTRPPGGARQASLACGRRCRPCRGGQGRASYTRLNGVSATRRNCVKPPAVTTSRILASPACAPSASPTSWESDAGVHNRVENE